MRVALALGSLAIVGLAAGSTVAEGSHQGLDFWLHCVGSPQTCTEEAVPTVTVTAPTTTAPAPSDCTVELQPGDSIGAALASAPVPAVVCLHGGIYSEHVVYNRNPSAYVTLKPYPGETVTIRSPNTTSSYHTLRTNAGSSRLRVQGLKWSGFCDLPCAADNLVSGGVLDLYGSFHQVVGNEIAGSGDQGIYSDDFSADFLIEGNSIHDNGLGRTHQSHGIYLQGNRHVVTGNRIIDHPQGFGIVAGDRGSDQVIVDNVIDHQGYVRNCCSGIVHWGANPGIRIEHNTITRTMFRAIERNTSASCVSVSYNSLGGGGISSFPCPMIDNVPD